MKTHLVNHHDCEQVADSGKQQSVHVVLHTLTDAVGKDIENDLADDKEEDAKKNVSKRPPLLQSSHDQQDLHHNIDKDEDGVEDV